MKFRSLIRMACFAIIVLGTSLYIYSRFALTKSNDKSFLIQSALSIPVGAGVALLATLNLRYFSSRLEPKLPGLAHTASWLFLLGTFVVFFLNLAHIWFITPLRVLSYFLVVLILSLLLNAGTYLHFRKQLDPPDGRNASSLE